MRYPVTLHRVVELPDLEPTACEHNSLQSFNISSPPGVPPEIIAVHFASHGVGLGDGAAFFFLFVHFFPLKNLRTLRLIFPLRFLPKVRVPLRLLNKLRLASKPWQVETTSRTAHKRISVSFIFQRKQSNYLRFIISECTVIINAACFTALKSLQKLSCWMNKETHESHKVWMYRSVLFNPDYYNSTTR